MNYPSDNLVVWELIDAILKYGFEVKFQISFRNTILQSNILAIDVSFSNSQQDQIRFLKKIGIFNRKLMSRLKVRFLCNPLHNK